MELTLPAALSVFRSSGAALGALNAWSRKLKGDRRALVLELGDNLKYLDMVADDRVPLGDVVEKLSAQEFERLARNGFNFNALKRGRIRAFPSLEGTNMASWPSKSTAELIESIYERLRDLKLRYPHLQHDDSYRWGVRVNNIRKRIWLLLRHVG
jgi:hypothetical protein